MTDITEAQRSSRAGQLESEIRRTTERVGHDIEAIGDKLSPQQITQRAKKAVSRKGANMLRTAKENPVPTAIIALGLTLLFKARKRDSGDGHTERWAGHSGQEGLTEQTQEKAREFVGAAGRKVEHAAEQAAEKAKRTGNQLQSFFEKNPIIAGVGVVALGAAVGALLPETAKENRIMGRARDEFVEQVESVAQHGQEVIEQKMSERLPQPAS